MQTLGQPPLRLAFRDIAYVSTSRSISSLPSPISEPGGPCDCKEEGVAPWPQPPSCLICQKLYLFACRVFMDAEGSLS
jgi:hypothetical protein